MLYAQDELILPTGPPAATQYVMGNPVFPGMTALLTAALRYLERILTYH